MRKVAVFIINITMIFIGPFLQFIVRLLANKYDNDGNIREEYMEKVNDCIPKFTDMFVDRILDIIYPPEKYEFGFCYRIWSTERFIYALLWYKWYSPADIEPDTFFD